MEYKLPLTLIKVSDKELLADLKRSAKKLGARTLTVSQYKEHGKYLAPTVITRFGGWVNALKKAGLQLSKHRDVSTLDLLLNMKKVWDTLGKSPSMSGMKPPLSEYAASAYVQRFGSWRSSLEIFIKYMNCKSPAEQKKMLARLPAKRRYSPADITRGLRFKVFQRDNYKCRVCGASPATDPAVQLHADHIIPYVEGGSTMISNLQTLCSKCNLGKGTSAVKKTKQKRRIKKSGM